jgi:hypothetical protein
MILEKIYKGHLWNLKLERHLETVHGSAVVYIGLLKRNEEICLTCIKRSRLNVVTERAIYACDPKGVSITVTACSLLRFLSY